MIKRPYARYTETEITVYGLTGAVRKQYKINQSDTVEVKTNRLFINGSKIKINPWFVDKGDWRRFIIHLPRIRL